MIKVLWPFNLMLFELKIFEREIYWSVHARSRTANRVLWWKKSIYIYNHKYTNVTRNPTKKSIVGQRRNIQLFMNCTMLLTNAALTKAFLFLRHCFAWKNRIIHVYEAVAWINTTFFRSFYKHDSFFLNYEHDFNKYEVSFVIVCKDQVRGISKDLLNGATFSSVNKVNNFMGNFRTRKSLGARISSDFP